MARTQYFSAPTEWKRELNLPLRQASQEAGYKDRLAILNGANWEDHGIPHNAHEPSYMIGWHAAEIEFARQDWTPAQHAQFEAEATMTSLEYRSHMRQQSKIAQRIAEIETADQIATAAEESFALSVTTPPPRIKKVAKVKMVCKGRLPVPSISELLSRD